MNVKDIEIVFDKWKLKIQIDGFEVNTTGILKLNLYILRLHVEIRKQ